MSINLLKEKAYRGESLEDRRENRALSVINLLAAMSFAPPIDVEYDDNDDESSSASSPSASTRRRVEFRDDVEVLHQGVHQETELAKKKNTKTAYKAKESEFLEFCDFRYSAMADEADRHLVTPEKVYKFMFYCAHRKQRKKGKRKRSFLFDRNEYEQIMASCGASTNSTEWQKPANPIGYQQFNTYKASVKLLFDRQKAKNRNRYEWDSQIWTIDCRRLQDIVIRRRAKSAKENFEEKIDSQFSLLKTHDVVPRVEAHMWRKGYDSNPRHNFTQLR